MTHLWSVEGHRRHGEGGGGALQRLNYPAPRPQQHTATSPEHRRKSLFSSFRLQLVAVYPGSRSVCCTLFDQEMPIIDIIDRSVHKYDVVTDYTEVLNEKIQGQN